jgi:hypothetical protein
MEERLLGYDAREMWLNYQDNWSQEHRNGYLLRENLTKPLSTDNMVWDEVTELCEIKTPDWIGANSIWEDLEHLEGFLGKHKQLVKPYWIILITWLSESPKNYKSEYNAPCFLPVKPAKKEDSWKFLGYDISDGWLLSGLMNCGYTPPDDIESLRKKWSMHLNEYHLFEDFDIAREFRDHTDVRVKEHAPFSVYGIYLVKTFPQ